MKKIEGTESKKERKKKSVPGICIPYITATRYSFILQDLNTASISGYRFELWTWPTRIFSLFVCFRNDKAERDSEMAHVVQ